MENFIEFVINYSYLLIAVSLVVIPIIVIYYYISTKRQNKDISETVFDTGKIKKSKLILFSAILCVVITIFLYFCLINMEYTMAKMVLNIFGSLILLFLFLLLIVIFSLIINLFIYLSAKWQKRKDTDTILVEEIRERRDNLILCLIIIGTIITVSFGLFMLVIMAGMGYM